MRRNLTLKKETLTQLSTAELDSVVGASGLPCTPVSKTIETLANCITGLQCVTNQTRAC